MIPDSNDSALPVLLVVGAGVTLAVGALALSRVAHVESAGARADRLVRATLERGVRFGLNAVKGKKRLRGKKGPGQLRGQWGLNVPPPQPDLWGAHKTGCWLQLGPEQYAEILTRAAYPDLPEDERQLKPEWSATTWLYDRMEQLVEHDPNGDEETQVARKHARQARLRIWGKARRAKLPRAEWPQVPPIPPIQLVSEKFVADPSLAPQYKIVHAALKAGDPQGVLTESERFVLKHFLEVVLAYERMGAALRPTANMTDLQRRSDMTAVNFADVGDVFCKDKEALKREAVREIRDQVNDIESWLDRHKTWEARSPNSSQYKRYRKEAERSAIESDRLFDAEKRGRAPFKVLVDWKT